jgi:N-acetylglucosaminyl-diphospho-decaprenol L-rhamnosyltransferase
MLIRQKRRQDISRENDFACQRASAQPTPFASLGKHMTDAAGAPIALTPVSARLSVIIVSHESVDVLAKTALSVARALPGAEIVVVENGPSEEALDAVRRLNIDVNTVRLHSNLGFGAGCNVGACIARRDFLFLLNPDAVVVDADLSGLASSLARSPFGVVAATGMSSSGKRRPLTRPDHGWRVQTSLYLARCFLKPSWFRAPSVVSAVATGPVWADGAAMLVRRDEFLEAGGFDERLFLYHEDLDLSRRYRRAGYEIASSPGIVVRHTPSTGSSVTSAFRIACALLSAVEMAEIWEADGDRAARFVVRCLQAMDRLPAPRRRRLGRGVARKREEARAVKGALSAVLRDRPPTQYPSARDALAGTRAYRS